MLGRTHMAVGLAAVSFIAPGLMIPVFTGLTKTLIFITSIAATVMGSLAPDLDHPNSKGSRQVFQTDVIGRVMTILIGAAIIYATYSLGLPEGFYYAGGFFIACGVMFFSLAKTVLPMEKIERIGMVAVGLLLLFINYIYHFHPVVNIFGLAYLVFGVLKHRGLTHSVLGWVLFGVGWYFLVKSFPVIKIDLPLVAGVYMLPIAHTLYPFVLGYGFHLAADFMTDSGIPLFYPWDKRVKLPVTITTSSVFDHLIGGAATLVFAWFVYQGFIF